MCLENKIFFLFYHIICVLLPNCTSFFNILKDSVVKPSEQTELIFTPKISCDATQNIVVVESSSEAKIETPLPVETKKSERTLRVSRTPS
jgi:hypothetical protein